MGTVPSCEALLLELQQSFGLNRLQTVQKRRFAARDKRLSEHTELFVEILSGIFDAIDYEHDPELLHDLGASAEEIFQFYSVVENNLRTYGATDRQVAWHLLSYVFAPGFARKYAFWSLMAHVAPGMAGGDLWFVPRPFPSDPTRLRLPVQAVVEWWEDLLNCPLEDIWDANDHDEDARDWIRNLQYWRAGKPPQANTIETAFAKMRRFKYLGTFRDEISAPLETRYQNAVSFVKEYKGFDATKLIREIPSTPLQVFEAGLAGTADEGQKKAFVAAVAERWREPTTATVRRRFLLARVVQDCHVRLAALICPKVDPDVAAPISNKLMQIWALFEETYRHTLAAQVGCRSEAESNARFATLVPTWLAKDHLRSVMDVHFGAPEIFTRWLSARFRELGATADVIDLFKDGELQAGPPDPQVDVGAAVERIELEGLLNGVWKAIEGGHAAEAEALLLRIDHHPRMEEFAADVLLLKGRHQLNANDTDGAKSLFEEAFEKCRAGGSGQTRNIVAFACLGIAVGFGRYSDKVERYCRVIDTSLKPNDLYRYVHTAQQVAPGLENLFRDLSVAAAEKFWRGLYRPYPGVEPMVPLDEQNFKALTEDFLKLHMHGDEEGLARWAKRNKKLLDTRLRNVRGDTFFSLTLKIVSHFDGSSRFPLGRATRLREGLHRLVAVLGRNTLDTPDFKGQTPLMLAAHQGDPELVRLLLDRGAEIDSQDIFGRTALHAAAAARASECYLLILEKGADPTRPTKDGLSPIHTAVKFGLPDAVEATLEKWPNRFSRDEIASNLVIARDIYANYGEIRTLMAKSGRTLGPKHAYKMIASILGVWSGI